MKDEVHFLLNFVVDVFDGLEDFLFFEVFWMLGKVGVEGGFHFKFLYGLGFGVVLFFFDWRMLCFGKWEKYFLQVKHC